MAKHWAFIAALLLQLAILVSIPMKKVLARATGQRVTLKTRPVDPYNILSGYYVILRYRIESPPKEMAEESKDLRYGAPMWFIVEPGAEHWELVHVRARKPAQMQEGQVAIRGTWKGHRGELKGADRLYIPEERRREVDKLMRAHSGEGLVDLAIGDDGEAAVIRLRIGGRSFGE